MPSTVDELLALHPLPPALEGQGEPLSFLEYVDVDADPEAMWPHVSDLARLNRAAGLGPMRVEERAGRAHGWRRFGPWLHEFDELGWEWSRGVWLAVTRRYERGAGRVARDLFRVDPRPGGGSRVYAMLTWTPRGALGAVTLRVGVPATLRRMCRVLADAAASARAAPRAPAPAFVPREAQPLPGAAERIEARAAQLQHLPEATISALTRYLERADDIDLDRIRPLELAPQWDVADDELVLTCLHATRAGLLEMTWDALCPHCRGVRHRATQLGDLPSQARCEPCAVEFETNRAEAVEITFQAHPSIRRRDPVLYCTAEPARKPHIVVQQCLEPGERREIESRLGAGRYRLRLVGAAESQRLHLDPNADEPLVWTTSGTRGGQASLAAPADRIVLVNDDHRSRTFVMEDESLVTRALRPANLFNHAEFRDLFSDEYLSTDVHLHVGEQTILFSDIVGSTAFYASRGDPDAFIEVVRHFEAIDAEVRRCRGVVVKTIGDAAMAAFSDPVDALACSEAILERYGPGRDDTPIRIRASMNTGPCIAVRLNSNIDYFGSTVNTAAKLQACAGAGQLALSESVASAPGVRESLRARGAQLADVTADLGTSGSTVRAYRWDVCEAAAREPA